MAKSKLVKFTIPLPYRVVRALKRRARITGTNPRHVARLILIQQTTE